MGYRDLAFAILSRFIDDIPPADLRRIVDATYTRDVFGSDAITPLSTLEPGLHLLHVSNGPTLAFKDIALQLLGNLFEYVLAREGRTINILGATSGDTGSSAEYALRGKRARHRVHAVARGPDEPVPEGADVLAPRREHPQPRGRRHVRRLPGHREGRERRRRVQGAPRDRRGQLDQLGPRRGADRLLLRRLLRRHARRRAARRLRRAVRQLRQHTRGPRRARARPAGRAPDPRDERERRARRVLPHRPLPPARVRRDARDVVAVDGHLQGVELRALRLRRRRARRRHGARAVGAAAARRRLRSLRHAALAARRGGGLRVRPQHARRPHRHDPRRARALRHRDRSAHRGRRQGGPRTARSGGAARLHRDRAAGEVRGDDPRGARPRARASGRVRRPRSAAAAVQRPPRRRRAGEDSTSRSARPPLDAPTAPANALRDRQPAAQPRRGRAPRAVPAASTRLAFRIDVPQLAAAVRAVGADRRRRRLVSRGGAARVLARWAPVPSSIPAALLLLGVRRDRADQPAAARRARAAGDRDGVAAAGAGRPLPAVRAAAGHDLRRGPAARRIRDRVLDRGRADPVRRGGVRADAPVRLAARDRRRTAARGADLVRQRADDERAVVARRRTMPSPRPAASTPDPKRCWPRSRSCSNHVLENLDDERPGSDRPLFRRLRARRADRCVSRGRGGRAGDDGRPLGHRRTLGDAGQQSADAADRAVRDRVQPARDAERDRCDHRPRGRRRDDLPRQPRRARITGSLPSSRRCRSSSSRPPG